MTFKKMCYNFIKIFLFFFLLSSCQTPKYSKVTNFSKSKNILPEVQYSISENFNPNNINCIAIGKIEDNSNQILNFTKEVKNMNEQNKIQIIEALWRIIYSNKEADIYETSLMRRLGGLLYVDNKVMGDIKEATESGDGPVDAIFKCIKKLYPHDVNLQLYNVHAVTEGTDAQATVSVRIEENGKTTVGQAANTDTLVASADAYLNALNKLIIKRKKTAPEPMDLSGSKYIREKDGTI